MYIPCSSKVSVNDGLRTEVIQSRDDSHFVYC